MYCNSINRTRIAIAWSGLPIYAIKSILKAKELCQVDVLVIGSKPQVPIKGIESELGQAVLWVDINNDCSWSLLNKSVPNIFFMTGWRNKAFNSLAREVKSSGGKVISLVDNCWKNTPRQWIGAIVFRVRYRRLFDYVWVPGKSATHLCRFLGMPESRIFQGLYCADPCVFYPESPLQSRNKNFIFVGRFIHRKGIDILLEAFSQFYQDFQDWTLTLIGSGDLIKNTSYPGVQVMEFQPSDKIASLMRKSRFLILPSREEHWGVVVHEAALSGCGIILSNVVGSIPDLFENNGLLFVNDSADSLYEAMVTASKFEDEKLSQIEFKSQFLASKFSTERWSNTFETIIRLTQNLEI
jgi:glycosyltransferase involved in cell wall biosynthesis